MSREEGATTPAVAARRERARAAGHVRNAEVLEFLGVLDFFFFFKSRVPNLIQNVN